MRWLAWVVVVIAGCPADDGSTAQTDGGTGTSAATGDTSGTTTGPTSSTSTSTGDASEASTDPSDASTAATSSSTADTTTATTGPIACGDDPTPPGGECPAECTGGCVDGVCSIDCFGDSTCADTTIVCPAGFACDVLCMGFETCRGTTVMCPAEYACAIECGGFDSCSPQIQCGNASCTLHCAFGDPCTDGTLECGPGACTATCDDPTQAPPTVNCGDACDCQAC